MLRRAPGGARGEAEETRVRRLVVGLFALLVGTGVSQAAPAQGKRIAVPDIKVAGSDASIGRALTEILTTETARVKTLTVISSSDIAAMLGFEKQKELLGCADNVACMAEIGGALGVDYLFVADVGLVGKTYVLNAKLIDTGKIEVLARIYKTIAGEPDALIEAVKACVPDILKPIAPADELARLAPAPAPAPVAAAARPAALTPPPSVTAQAPVLSSGPTRWPGWTFVGLGAAGLAVAGGVGLKARSDYSSAEQTRMLDGIAVHSEDAARRYDDARSEGRASTIAAVAGGAVTLGGVVWLLVTSRSAPVAVTLQVDHESTGAAVVGRF